MTEGCWVGLDVHARTTAAVRDAASGEVRLRRVPPRSDETVAWLRELALELEASSPAGECPAFHVEPASTVSWLSSTGLLPRSPRGASC
jgi:hypothetical protein